MVTVDILLQLSKYFALPILFSYLVWETFLPDKKRVSSIFLILAIFSLIIGGFVGVVLLHNSVLHFISTDIQNPYKIVESPTFLWQWNMWFLIATLIISIISFKGKNNKEKGLVKFLITVFIFLFAFYINLLIKLLISIFSLYSNYVSSSLFLIIFYFTFVLLILLTILYFIFNKTIMKATEDIKRDIYKIGKNKFLIRGIIVSIILIFISTNYYSFPDLETKEEIQKYVIQSVYSNKDQFSHIKTLYEIKRLGTFGWIPLEFNYNLEDSNAREFFEIYINTTSGRKNLIGKYELRKEKYVLSDGNVTQILIPQKGNYAILFYNAKSLKEINATHFVIEGYRNLEPSENFDFNKQDISCEPYKKNVSLCRTDIKISNKFNKSLEITSQFIRNYEQLGYSREKCGFGNMTVVYSGNDTIKFEEDCSGDYGCESPYYISLFDIILMYEKPALYIRRIQFTEKADLNISVEFFCSK